MAGHYEADEPEYAALRAANEQLRLTAAYQAARIEELDRLLHAAFLLISNHQETVDGGLYELLVGGRTWQH